MQQIFRAVEVRISRLADWCTRWFAGPVRQQPEEVIRKRALLGLGLTIAAPLFIVEGVTDLMTLRIAEGTLSVGLGLAIAAVLPGFRQIERLRPLLRFLLLILALVLAQGAITGGEVGSNGVWLLIFPLVAILLCGRREGFMWSMVVLAGVAIGYSIAPTDNRFGYPMIYKFRLAAGYLSVLGLAYAYELFSAGTRFRLEKEHQALQKKSEMLTSANAKIRRMSRTDALTRCYNRGYLNQNLPREMARCRRYRHPLSIILCDLDHFKSINDDHGHQFGDAVLRQLVLHLSGELRGRVDWLARYGGEEFLIVLPETPEIAACSIAERLRYILAADPMSANGVSAQITASFGVAGWDPEDDQTPDSADELIRIADKRLYMAKRTGRNRVVGSQSLPSDQDTQLRLIQQDSSEEKG